MSTIQTILNSGKIIPVVTLEKPEDAVPVAEALLEGGIQTIEITLRTEAAIAAIEVLARKNTGITIGAGTVTTATQFRQVMEAGAAFVVSPGMTDSLLRYASQKSMPYLPGIATASEIMIALEHGITAFKFFPAESMGGTATLKHLSAVFPQVRFCPTGGVTAENMQQYLALSGVVCIGGSWLVAKEDLRMQDWKHITQKARHALSLV